MSASTINGYAALAKQTELTQFSYEPAKLTDYDVEIEISHCGICHSDLHLIDNDWGVSKYPLVPGHEIVGNIIQVCEKSHHTIGSRVGVGWQRSACLECDECISGNEQLCLKQQATCKGNYGGFANRIIVDGRFAFVIPESLSSETAAPLLCAGATVFSPLQHFNVRPGQKVGVIGIGGLGHLAIQFAHFMGCEVTAFSSSADKETESKKFGADHFVNLSNNNLRKLRRSQDFLLNTSMSENQDWHALLQTLKSDGRLCIVGAPSKPINLSLHHILDGRRSISGSNIGSRTDIQKMLNFAALHNIKPQTEVIPISRVNDAIAKLRQNKVRYRIVLQMK